MPKHNRRRVEINNITIENMSSEGKGLFRHENQVVFVKDSIPGDVCDVVATKKKKNYLEGFISKMIEPSPLRIEPKCEHFDLCGGCKWQSVTYADQLKFKQQHVIDSMERLGHLEGFEIGEILGCEEEFEYRNKLEYTFSATRWFTKEEINNGDKLESRGVGFHIPGQFDKIIDVNRCHLQVEPTNEIRNFIKDWGRENDISFYNIKKHEGFLRNLVIRTTSTGEVMVICQFGHDSERVNELMGLLKQNFPSITSLNYVINEKKNEIFTDLDVITYSGNEFITEKMMKPDGSGDLNYRISPKSFYQTNSKQAERLYKLVYELAELHSDDVVYDLYTGTGTIANYLSPYAKSILGIEYIEAAVEDAYDNAKLNGIENTSFYSGDMVKVLTDDFIEEKGKPNIIIADPPRAGMHADVCQTILRCAPKRIIYVSCNPSTQARDLQILSEKYKVVKIQPVDMFPHTPHVENIAVLDKL